MSIFLSRFAEAACLLLVLGYFAFFLGGCAARVGPSEVLPGVEVEAGYTTSALEASLSADAAVKVDGPTGFCAVLNFVGLGDRFSLCAGPAPAEETAVEPTS